MTTTISAKQIYKALTNLCDTIENEKEYLSELDGAIGDGDHGVNMAKCFRGVKSKLENTDIEDVGGILSVVGMEVMNSVGGAMGALYGTLFIKMSEKSTDKAKIDLTDLAVMFKYALDGLLSIGKANVGDKTLVDTITPAVTALEQSVEKGERLDVALAKFEAAAKSGMESTKDLQAKMGRASRLGERTIGHQDAGATSCYFILQAFAHSSRH